MKTHEDGIQAAELSGRLLRNAVVQNSLILMVSFVLLTAATYAWFTITLAPQVRGLMSAVTSNGSLEIALAGPEEPKDTTLEDGDLSDLRQRNQTWGNIIRMTTDVYTELETVMLQPVTLTEGNTFGYPLYGDDGRVMQIQEIQNFTDSQDNGFALAQENDTTFLYRLDVWLRSNTEGRVGIVRQADVQRMEGIAGSEGKGSLYLLTSESGESSTSNESLQQLLPHMKVVIFDNEGGKLAELKTDEDGFLNYTEDGTGYVLEITGDKKDQPQLIHLYSYLEGAELSNHDLAALPQNTKSTLNLQFCLLDTEMNPMSVNPNAD